VSITNAKNRGPSGAGEKLLVCPTLKVELDVDFIAIEEEAAGEALTCWILLLGGGI
jgi:hypothetical protein